MGTSAPLPAPSHAIFRNLANSLQAEFPSLRHAIPVLLRDQPDGPVAELDARAVSLGGQAVLEVIDGRVGHWQRPADFQQRGRLDDLHVAPQVSCIISQVPEPASAGPASSFNGSALPSGIWLSGPSSSSIAW